MTTIDSKALEAAVDLPPCPFCGGGFTNVGAMGTSVPYAEHVGKDHCIIGAIRLIGADDFAAWNRRALPSPKVEGEPVAWKVTSPRSGWHVTLSAGEAELYRKDGSPVVPLYASPSSILADEGADKARLDWLEMQHMSINLPGVPSISLSDIRAQIDRGRAASAVTP